MQTAVTAHDTDVDIKRHILSNQQFSGSAHGMKLVVNVLTFAYDPQDPGSSTGEGAAQERGQTLRRRVRWERVRRR